MNKTGAGVSTPLISNINGTEVPAPENKSGAATLVADKSTTKVVPPGYKQTKVGVIPEEWDTPRIDMVLRRIRKKVDVEKERMYQQIGIRSHAKGIFHKELVSGEALGNKSVFWVDEDCFIVNIVFAWEQAVAKTTEVEKGMIASHRFPMYKAKDNKVDIDYILYFFKSKRGKHLLGLASPGGAGRNKTLGQKEFSELKLPLPSLKEQEKITRIFVTLDDAISKQDDLIKAKETLKKGLMQKLLSGDVRFDGFDGEWEKKKLGDIGDISTGTTPSTKINEYYNNGVYPWITPTDIQTKKDIYTSKKLLSELGLKKGRLIKKNSLLVTCIASIGKNTILKTDGSCNQQINAIFVNKKHNVDFLYYLIEYKKHILISYAGQGGMLMLNKNDFSNLRFMFPLLHEQEKIAQVLTTADKEIELLKKELEALKEQKRGLMQRLLTGEVRTNNIKENE